VADATATMASFGRSWLTSVATAGALIYKLSPIKIILIKLENVKFGVKECKHYI